MNAVKTIDVKGLPHAQREEMIFPGIEALKPGETARLVVEFNPVPLVFLLKAEKELEVAYEKEGPDEWILRVTKQAKKKEEDKKAQFRELLAELGEPQLSDAAKEKARTLLQEVDAKTLGILEQELIREGVPHETIRKSLCDIHLEVMRDSLVAQRKEVSAPHPVHTFMQEHEHIVASLKDLDALVKRLQSKNSYGAMGEDLEKLKDIAHHLVEAESHHRREEEVLFPEMEKHDITEPPEIMRLDHIEFRKRKQALYQIAHNSTDYAFPEFKARVTEYGLYLTKELESHIFKEDNILYQIALQVLTPEDWAKVKEECDKVGYCCFTPEDYKMEEAKMVELDLRQIMPFERHELIFQKWDALKPGDTLKIINDHDPKPLRYQFEVEYKGQYEWQYDQQGPKDWIVSIKRV
ncbi:MAG: DUF438 domain-containing protein [Chloroflexi bacterium]|nr:DUF438 domain-containing protein [Chloroflexota bacterium]